MRGRPGRVLPSVIVGGLLVSGLALGAGTATAAASTCKNGADTYDISKSSDVTADVDGGQCALTSGAGMALSAALALLQPVPAAPASGGAGSASDTTTSETPAAGAGAAEPSTGGATNPSSQNGQSAAPVKSRTKQTKRPSAPALATPAPAALPAPVVAAPRAAVPAPPLAALAPALTSRFAPAAFAAASLPGGLGSSLFSANAFDPSLLFGGSPVGAAAAQLYVPTTDQAVTSVSRAEPLATVAPHGLTTPVVVAAIALACVVALGMRRRVLSRLPRRELAAGYLDPGPVDLGQADLDQSDLGQSELDQSDFGQADDADRALLSTDDREPVAG
jgi:hypothetical protein